MTGERPAWDFEKAAALIGRRVLIGITFVGDGKADENAQLHGVVVEADAQSGIVIALEGVHDGETYRLPPDMAAFHPAEAGDYRLHSTGEVVTDPDFTATWTVDRPQDGGHD